MITLENLSFRYNKKEDILLNITTQINEGHIYGLLGKNGTGKSTLLKLLSGMLFPSSGEVTTIGHTPSKINSFQLKHPKHI